MSSSGTPLGTTVFWFVGLPASGKTTLARSLLAHLDERPAVGTNRLFDADVERADSGGVLHGLGWSSADRRCTIEALAQASLDVSVALVTLVTSTAWERVAAQQLLGDRLHLIYVDAPITLCRQRDALRSAHAYQPSPPPDAPELSWSPPLRSALHLDTTRPLQQSTAELLAYADRVLSDRVPITLPATSLRP